MSTPNRRRPIAGLAVAAMLACDPEAVLVDDDVDAAEDDAEDMGTPRPPVGGPDIRADAAEPEEGLLCILCILAGNDPVCGEDNVTYGNTCWAACDAVEVVHAGACACGDGYAGPGEACDDGNTNDNDGCRNDCTVPSDPCGNGVLDAGEACDDGDTVDDNGCSADCSSADCLVPVTHPTVQAAVDDLACGPAMWVMPGTYTENIYIDRDDFVIEGVPLGIVTLDGGGIDSVVRFGLGSNNVTLRGLVITNGWTEGSGGGISTGEATHVTLEGTTVANNVAGVGGGISTDYTGSVTLTNSIVRDNEAAEGGGVYVWNSSLYVNGGAISDNRASAVDGYGGDGGGIYASNGGLADIRGAALTGNEASSVDGAHGGAVHLDRSAAVLVDSTLSGNSATGADAYGGAVHVATGSGLYIVNSTLSGNSVSGTSTAIGGGIGVGPGFDFPTYLDLRNATLTNNAVTGGPGGASGGGIGVGDPLFDIDFKLRNSIVAGNTAPAGPDCGPGIGAVSGGHNLFGVGTNCPIGVGAIGDPELGALADNGGTTRTHAITDDSPAFDAGDPAGCTDLQDAPLTTDQRGEARPAAAQCDIGAFEVQP